MNSRHRIAAAALGICLLAAPAAVHAAECAGVRFPDQIELGGTEMPLHGLGLREATAFNVDVYVAGLYAPGDVQGANELLDLEDSPRHLSLSFVRDVGRKDINEAWREGFAKNAGQSMGRFQADLDRLTSWMVDLKRGDDLGFTYRPEAGLQVTRNGQELGVIDDQDFAETFMRIFIGPNPPNPGLRTGLLGGECG